MNNTIIKTVENKIYKELRHYIMTVIDNHIEDSTVIDYSYSPYNSTLKIIGREDIVNEILRDAYELYAELVETGEISA